MNQSRTIFVVIVILFALFASYYFFIDTLSLSQVVGQAGSPKATIFINIFDFDTGLTRYDVYHINRKSEYWKRRIQEVQSIADATAREKANEALLAEMMQDPSLKKITRKCLGFGAKSAGTLMRIVASIVYQS